SPTGGPRAATRDRAPTGPGPTAGSPPSRRPFSPQRGRAPVAGELAGHVDRDRYRQDVDDAVLVRGAPDAVRGHGRGGSAPELPAARDVEAAALGAGAERAELVRGPHDAFERGHEQRA